MSISTEWLLAAIAAFAIAGVLSGVLTLVVRRLAPRLGLIDQPDQHRKLHRQGTPLGGGIAVFLAAVVLLALGWFLPSPLQDSLCGNPRDLVALLISAAIIVALGVLDDLFSLRGRQKLAGQILAAAVLIVAGLSIERIVLFDYPVDLGILSIPFTLFWLLGAINAVNLLDGIDGLATVLGVLLSGSIALMAAMTGHPSTAVVAIIFAGSLTGFLRFNFPPASIFLGDAGSMLIGLVVGFLAVQGSLKGPGTVLLAAPLAIWTIPVLDSAAALVRRKLTGRSIYLPDRAHLHHRLMDRLGSNRKVLIAVSVCCLAACGGALASLFFRNDVLALMSCLGVVAVLAASGLFGRTESRMLLSRLRGLATSLFRGPARNQQPEHVETSVRLQGSEPWECLWKGIVRAAEENFLGEAILDVSMPFAREEYHASWSHLGLDGREHCWIVEVPLTAQGRTVGRLRLVSSRFDKTPQQSVARVVEMLAPIQARCRALAEKALPAPVEETDALVPVPAVAVPALSASIHRHGTTDARTTTKHRKGRGSKSRKPR
jgi:UDP-GlcNAc:undecaprenyl-phosphate GlcNAc-1-phosphate transferase